jgi:hypothetical protein
VKVLLATVPEIDTDSSVSFHINAEPLTLPEDWIVIITRPADVSDWLKKVPTYVPTDPESTGFSVFSQPARIAKRAATRYK